MIVFGDKSSIGYYKVLFWKKLFSINEDYLLLLDEKHSGKKYQFWSNILVFRNIYQCHGLQKYSILKKYIGFQKYIPVPDCKNINFEEIHWFSEIYTSFGLPKYQFLRNTLVFIYIYTCCRITKISIFKKYIDFQQYIPVSDDNT